MVEEVGILKRVRKEGKRRELLQKLGFYLLIGMGILMIATPIFVIDFLGITDLRIMAGISAVLGGIFFFVVMFGVFVADL